MNDTQNPRFCSDCGMPLTNPGIVCTSRSCEECGREIFYSRPGEDGGIKVEKGERLHIPPISFSLDPSTQTRFFRPGLEGFLKQLYLEKKFQPEELADRFKEIESAIDRELNGLDCIQHCDLETNEGAEEAARILESEDLKTHWFNLVRSSYLRNCYEAIEDNDVVKAVYSCHFANIFKEYALLEDEHLKEILWIGYLTYCDLKKNEGATIESTKEIRLAKSIGPKIKSIESELAYSLVNDGLEIGKRIGVTGISEQTLKCLLEHELNQRSKKDDLALKEREIRVHEMSNKIKLWGFLFTLANALILALYMNWLG